MFFFQSLRNPANSFYNNQTGQTNFFEFVRFYNTLTVAQWQLSAHPKLMFHLFQNQKPNDEPTTAVLWPGQPEGSWCSLGEEHHLKDG